MQNIAIVGFGCAGYNCLKAIRENGFSGEIDIYTNGFDPPHNPMLTTYYLENKLGRGSMFPFGSLEEIKSKYSFNLIAEEEVLEITTDKKVITSKNTKEYNKILIATGAEPFIPNINWKDKPNIFVMRTKDDALKLEEFLLNNSVKNAVVVGASMVGIKVCELFKERDINTTLVDMGEYIFPISATKEIAKIIEAKLIQKGINLKMSCGLKDAVQQEDGLKVTVGDEIISADCLVLCIGTKPKLSMLKSPKFKISGGLLVDKTMETSVKDIFAAGDCTSSYDFQIKDNRPIGLWDIAWQQGEIAGKNICGIHTVYKGNAVRNITKFFDMTFASMGDVNLQGEEHIYTDSINNWVGLIRVNNNVPVVINILNNSALSGIMKGVFTKKYLSGEKSDDPIIKSLLIEHKLPLNMIELILGGGENE